MLKRTHAENPTLSTTFSTSVAAKPASTKLCTSILLSLGTSTLLIGSASGNSTIGSATG